MAGRKQTDLPQVGRCFGSQSHSSSQEDMPEDSGEGNSQPMMLQEVDRGTELGAEQVFARSSLTGRSPPFATNYVMMTEEHLDDVHRSVQVSLDESPGSQGTTEALAQTVGRVASERTSMGASDVNVSGEKKQHTLPPGERRRLAREKKMATGKWLPPSEWRKQQREKRKRIPEDTPPPGRDTKSGISPLRRQATPKRQRRSDIHPHQGAQSVVGPSTSGEPSFKEQLTSKKLAIVPAAFPDVRFSDDDCCRIQAKLGDLVLDDESAEGPLQISRTFREKGAVVAVCCNELTCDWLKSIAASLVLREGDEVLVGDYKDLLRSIKVLLRIDKAFPQGDHMEPKRVLLGLQKQNPGISTKDWRIVSRRQEADHQTLVLMIDESSAQVLSRQGWRAFLAATRVTFKVLSGVSPAPAPGNDPSSTGEPSAQ